MYFSKQMTENILFVGSDWKVKVLAKGYSLLTIES
jgi:hypothetical protein